MSYYPLISKKDTRVFLPVQLTLESWESVLPWFEKLEAQNPDSVETLKKWLRDWDEISAMLEENMAWRYIRMTCNTKDEKARSEYEAFLQDILPHQTVWTDRLQKKYQQNPYRAELTEAEYRILDRSIMTSLELFREENVPLQTEIYSKAQEFGAISGAMTIEWEGKTLTLQQAAVELEHQDRNHRQLAWEKIQQRRLENKEDLHALLDTLCDLRGTEAKTAGFENYTDYKFRKMGRYDYTVQDCLTFHDSVEAVVKPVYHALLNERKERLGLDTLKPWDLSVDIYGDTPLRPFKEGEELIEKAIELFEKIRPELAGMIRTMKAMGHLDLESRQGKAPGGYNHPLAESGVPFIFMNAAGTQDDLNTMMHEAGHAFHSFLTHDLELNDFKNTPSEIAELASMSMELISSRYWDVFYKNPEDLRRAHLDHLTQSLFILTWVATVDAFQHWLYAHPGHTHAEREAAWVHCYYRFQGDDVDWSGLEMYLQVSWQKQMHIYEVPFYYIEYGFAQLGAFGVWKNYLEHPDKALNAYLTALQAGYTRSIPEVYALAGIRFDFSKVHIRTLMDFGLERLEDFKSEGRVAAGVN